MSEFEKWKAKHLASGESKTWVEWCKEAFKAGQQCNQAIIDDLQNQLKLCREENKGLIKTLNDEKNLIDESNKSAILLGKVDVVLEGWKKDQIKGLEKTLRGENEK